MFPKRIAYCREIERKTTKTRELKITDSVVWIKKKRYVMSNVVSVNAKTEGSS